MAPKISMNVSAAAQKAVATQRAYYAQIADNYDGMHLHQHDEHSFALRFMLSMAGYLGIRSILDIGSGTGRGLLTIATELPEIKAVGVEPSAELREIGYSKGLLKAQLVDGDAMSLSYDDNSFDLVCEFGALHHIPEPAKAVAEMLRVAGKAILISDCNNFGQGSRPARMLKQALNAAGLWSLAYRIKTGGKGYTVSEGDGLAYSYSVFNNYEQIRAACESVHILNTTDGGRHPYRDASHVALLGIKRSASAPD